MKSPLYLIITLATLSLFLPGSVSAFTASKTLPNTSSLNRGLVGWWTFDGADQATTVTSSDKSGNGNGGAKVGGVTTAVGKIGQAMRFNGSTGYVNVADAASLRFTEATPFTVSCWFKTSASGVNGEVITKRISNDRYEFIFGSDNKLQATIGDGTSILNISSLSTLNNNKWHFAVLRYDGANNLKFYIDGALQGTDSSPTLSGFDTTGAALTIGKGSNGFFPGSIDDVRVYNRALSAKEITQLYQTGAGAKVSKTDTVTTNLNSGLKGWYTFDGADRNTAAVFDMSGNSFPGTATAVGRVAGKIGQGGSFNGTTSRILTTSASNIMSAGTGSISVWFKPTGGTLSGTYVYDLPGAVGDGGAYYNIGYGNPATLGDYIWLSCFDTTEKRLNVAYTKNKWTHIVWVHTGGNLYGYKDGVLFGSTACGNLGSLGGNFHIGEGFDGFFSGSIDDVRVYNRALSAKEVTQLYQEGSGIAASKTLVTPTLNRGLVGWYTFDGADVNATKVFDKSASANTGSRSASVTMAKGKTGQAGKFNGSNSYISAGTQSVSGSFTLSCWIKTNTVTAYQRCVEKGYYTTGWLLGVTNAGKVDFTVGSGTDYRQLTGLTSLLAKRWYHIVGRYDSSVQKMYVYLNGVLDAAPRDITGFTVANTSATVQIGAEQSVSYLFNGLIDDVRAYNRALSAKEITQLYQMGK